MREHLTAGRAGTKHYVDLGAVIHIGHIPPDVALDLPKLYGSFRCSLDYHETYNPHKFDDNAVAGVCLLSNPRHILLFTASGRSVEVLNIAYQITPTDVARACRALFRALPGTQEIRAEVPFQPRDLRLPRWTRGSIDHMSIMLPEEVDDYESMIGSRTRRNLRTRLNRLRREHPDITTVVYQPTDDHHELVQQMVTWKSARFRERGRTTYWDEDEGLTDRFADLVRRRGRAHVTLIDNEPAAVRITFAAGDVICSMEGAFDPRFAEFDLGLLSYCDVVRQAIRDGAKRLDLTSGNRDHKERLGAKCTQAWRISVFRHRASPLLMPRKTFGAVARRLSRR